MRDDGGGISNEDAEGEAWIGGIGRRLGDLGRLRVWLEPVDVNIEGLEPHSRQC
jgi:hypothetical protein